MLDIGLLLTIIGVLLAAPVLWIVGLVVVAFGALRWLVAAVRDAAARYAAARYPLDRLSEPPSLTTVSH